MINWEDIKTLYSKRAETDCGEDYVMIEDVKEALKEFYTECLSQESLWDHGTTGIADIETNIQDALRLKLKEIFGEELL